MAEKADSGATPAIEVVSCHAEGEVGDVIVGTNVPSFAARLGDYLEVEGFGTLTVDTAYGGDSFVIVEAARLGFELVPGEARDLCETGMKITHAANQQLGFAHPENPDWDHLSFCQFAGPLARTGREISGPNAVAIRPGKIAGVNRR